MMLLDYLAHRKKRAEKEHLIVDRLGGHDRTYADRVEKIVCEIEGVSPTELRTIKRKKKYAYARFLIYYILLQTNGKRNGPWLAKRYNTDQWSVHYGAEKVIKLQELKNRAITVMTLLERQIEFELFGPVEAQTGAENGGVQERASEASRRCDPLLWE